MSNKSVIVITIIATLWAGLLIFSEYPRKGAETMENDDYHLAY